jgi:hypothetical protein
MAKKERKQLSAEEKKERKLQKLYIYYAKADSELGLAGKDINTQIQNLVTACLDIQCEICKSSDSIKIDDLTKIKDITNIDKKTYMDFVNICALKNNDKLKEKAIQKFESDFENRLVIANLRHSFLESYMSGNELKITDGDNYEYKPFSDYKSEEFEKIMEDSAKKREYINKVLYGQFKTYAKAAEYITKLELTYGKFKQLVDWEYYKEGGYPSPTTPAKLWSIFNRFNESIRLITQYGFTQQDGLCKEFGLNIELVKPVPVKHPWMTDDPTIEDLDEE